MPKKPLRTYGRASIMQNKSYTDGPRQTFIDPLSARVLQRQAQTPTPSTKQQTLTQIDFISRTPIDLLELDLDYEQPEPERPAKKQKVTAERSIPTGFSGRRRQRHSSRLRSPDQDIKIEKEAEGLARQQGRKDVTPSDCNMLPPPVPGSASALRSPVKQRTLLRREDSTPQTPQKIRRQDVPSSQSPEEGLSAASSRGSKRRYIGSPLRDVTNTSKSNPIRVRGKPSPKLRRKRASTIKQESQISTQAVKTQERDALRRSTAANKENVRPEQEQPRTPTRVRFQRPTSQDSASTHFTPFVPDSEDVPSTDRHNPTQFEHQQGVMQEGS